MGCSAVGASPLSWERFSTAAAERRFLDHRAADPLQLLAFAAGLLPHPSAPPLSRRSEWALAANGSEPEPQGIAEAMRCAVCRLTVQELQLAADVASSCDGKGDDDGDGRELLIASVDLVCEHMEARGILGHTEKRAGRSRQLCDTVIRRHRKTLRRLLLNPAEAATSLGIVSKVCGDSCSRSLGFAPVGELSEWPAVVQLLLDQAYHRFRTCSDVSKVDSTTLLTTLASSRTMSRYRRRFSPTVRLPSF